MFPLVSFLFSLIGLSIATYTDFKERIIPDWVSYGMIVLGLSLAAYESFSSASMMPLFWSAVITGAVFILAYLFWRAGAWAGGDVKLFTGLAALNPFNPFVLGSFFNLSFVFGGKELLVASALPFFMLNLFVVSVIALMPYSAFLAFTALHRASNRAEFFSITQNAVMRALEWGLLIVLFTHVLNQLSIAPIFLILVLVIVGFIPPVIRKGLVILSLIGIFWSVISWVLVPSVLIVLVAVNTLLAWYGFAQRHVLTTTKKISALKDGDIPGEWIGLKDGKVVRENGVSFKTIIKAGMDRDLGTIMRIIHPSGDAWADPRQAAGVYPEQIALLQNAVKKGLLDDIIKVKASAPFAPAVWLAYVLLNALGDGPLAWGWSS